MSTLSVELRAGQSLRIGDAVVRLDYKTGKTARLLVMAPPNVPVTGGEQPRNHLRELAQMCARAGQTDGAAFPPTMQ